MQHVRLAANLAILNVILFRPSRGIHDRDIPLAASGTLKSAFHENIISERFEFMKPLRFRRHAEARERCPLPSERPFISLPGVAWRAALIRAALCYTKKRLRDILPLLIRTISTVCTHRGRVAQLAEQLTLN